MNKFLTFGVLIALAVVAAAIFGAAHNQLSYTMGPSYFTGLKFPQFGLPEDTAPRVGAAWVGVQASWWVGAIVGLPAFLFGLFAAISPRTYFAAGLGAIFTVVFLAVLGALLGLIGGIVADNTGLLDPYVTAPEGVDRRDFLRAGLMHEASYLAGAIGLIAAVLTMNRARKLDARREVTHAT